MALREFRDSTGRAWVVWDTYPRTHAPVDRTKLELFMRSQPKEGGVQPVSVRRQYASGWLTFTADNERRRLVPIPKDWEKADVEDLRRLLRRSEMMNDPRAPRTDE